MNGITYRGAAVFGFRVYRFWSEDDGWGDWQDTTHYGNVFLETLSRAFLSGMSGGFSGAYDLRFQIEQKDGHWRVLAEDGSLFVNGALVGSVRKGFRACDISQPKLEIVQKVAVAMGRQRVMDATTGDQVKATPEEIDRNAIGTMTMLRGRPLL